MKRSRRARLARRAALTMTACALGCGSAGHAVVAVDAGGSGGAQATLATASGGRPDGVAGGASGGQAGASAVAGIGGNATPSASGAGGNASGSAGSPPAGAGGGASSAGNGNASGAAAVGSAGSSASAGAAGTAGSPKNPVLRGLNADPQIAAFGGKFYIYPTSDGFANWLSTQFHAFSSSDLLSWQDEGVVLDLGPGITWADDRAWAPGIAFKDGTYYFYFAAAQQIGVATSASPTGPFKDALGHALISAGQYGGQSIDPYAFMDDDGRAYLYFGSSSAGGHVVELNADMVSFKGTPSAITVSGFREGSVAFKRNGKYYFMWSENDTRSADYDVAYGIGTSPLGPFTRATVNPILKKDTTLGILGTGHNSVLQLANGDYYIAYHRFAIPGGDGTHREVCLDRLIFNADGTIAPVKPTL